MAAGASGALALPPVGFTPAMIVSMTAAVWLIDGVAVGASWRSRIGTAAGGAFAIGWWWGFGYFIAGLWWLGAAFIVDGDTFLWALPFGVVGLPLFLALFPALGFALAAILWPPGALRPFALAVGLSVSETLRANLLTGFPWNEYGMALGQALWPAQAAAFVGLHGLTLLTVAIFAAPATLADGGRRAPAMLAALTLASLCAFGALRLSQPAPANVTGPKLRLVQPNVGQGADFSPENGAAILGGYLRLSDRATSPQRSGIADVTHLFWPESAFPFILAHDRGALARIVDFLHGGATLVTGAAREEETAGQTRYLNSIEVVDAAGLEAARYDKHKLVPFGEFLPLRSLFDRLGITQFVQIPGGFSPGTGSRILHIPGLPDALGMICYEAIFPNEKPARTGEAASVGFILNVTDDAWFGRTAGPYQHFAQARLRAVELGLPMLRVANTGISAILSARGEVLDEAPLGVQSVIDGVLPGALPPTVQARLGLAIWTALTAAAAALCVLAIARSRRTPT